MEPKWVLTSGQKKIRFRNLLKRRQSKKVKASKPKENSSDEHKRTMEEHKHERLVSHRSLDHLNKHLTTLTESEELQSSRNCHPLESEELQSSRNCHPLLSLNTPSEGKGNVLQLKILKFVNNMYFD